MHTGSPNAVPPSCFVRCEGCGRQMRVPRDRLQTDARILCGWCQQDLLRAETVRNEEAEVRPN
jgi:hypothetical protein